MVSVGLGEITTEMTRVKGWGTGSTHLNSYRRLQIIVTFRESRK